MHSIGLIFAKYTRDRRPGRIWERNSIRVNDQIRICLVWSPRNSTEYRRSARTAWRPSARSRFGEAGSGRASASAGGEQVNVPFAPFQPALTADRIESRLLGPITRRGPC